jgi:hypothetical protein
MPTEHESSHDTPARDSERLARLYFRLAGTGGDRGMLDLMHPDVEIELRKLAGPRTLQGKAAVARFLDHLGGLMYGAVADTFEVVDDDRIVVMGRMRWMDEDRILRDDPMIWALEFRDGLLYRSTPARTIAEAHAFLRARRGEQVAPPPAA